ncbi:MAG: hypothetical protein HY234_02655 [Acidobacteria bacterium]|nr:hypothetical protein [Acidobacteriota bacterium]MBI3661936.1 hypothetical protein [Acidobacteriota bacterium]
MLKWRVQTWALVVVLALAVPAAWAQQQKDPRLNPPVAPLPPLSLGESSSKASLDDPAANPQNAVKPDESPLSGAEAFSLGTKGGGRSFVTPTIRFTQLGDNNKRSATSLADWRTAGTLTGQLALQHIKARSQLGIDYSAGGTLYSTTSSYRSSFHRLGLSEQISFRRWTLLLADSFTFLPESSFGSGGLGGISTGLPGGMGNGGIGTGLGGFGGGFGGGIIPGITPNQSILTDIGRRVSNTVLGQIQYTISPRASMTASGTYGLLRFLDSGFIDSNNYQFMSGYNYKMTAADTIGVVYTLSMMRFGGINRSADIHSIHLAYGRRLTGRLALRLSGGPRVNSFENPLSGSKNSVSWGLRSSLLYNFRNTDLGLNYSHGATTGSGVVVGADTDRVEGTITRQLTRMWNGGLVFGFAHNQSIRQLNTVATNLTVNTWHTGFRLQRPVSRQASLTFSYNLTGQTANTPTGCTGLACGRMPLRHQFALGFTWGFGPYEID